MDLAYWGFRHWPFERTFAADRFFLTPNHEEALARLLFLVEEFRQTGIVMGPTGSGKTFLLKRLQQRAERLGRQVVCSEATGLDGYELISQIAFGCHVPCDPDASAAKIWSCLNAKFAALTLVRQPLVILIDHFDLVEFSCQQTVCRLRQLADSCGLKLTVILATRDRIIPAALLDIVELKIDLVPWSSAEMAQFITTSIALAGSSEILFTDEALRSLHVLTKGIPTNVVALCNLTLLAAMGAEEKLITSELVQAAADELPSRPGDHPAKQRLPARLLEAARS